MFKMYKKDEEGNEIECVAEKGQIGDMEQYGWERRVTGNSAGGDAAAKSALAEVKDEEKKAAKGPSKIDK